MSASSRWVAIAALALGCGAASPVAAGQPPELDRRVNEQLPELTSTAWEKRAAAFYEVVNLTVAGGLNGRTFLMHDALAALFKESPARRERVSVALISLLERENAVQRGAANPRSEEYSSYVGDVIAAVAELHDRRAIDALLDNVATGALATRGLAALGAASLDRLLGIIAADDGAGGLVMIRKMGATRALAQMLDPAIVTIDEATRARIRGGLIQAAKDRQSWVRLAAVEGLAKLPESEARGQLEALADADPFSRPGDGGQAVYPVRDAARKALAGRGR